MRPVRAIGTVLVLLALAGSLLLTLTRSVLTEPHLAVLAASFAPFAVASYAVAALLALLLLRGARRRLLLLVVALVSVAGLVLHLAWLAPEVAGDPATGPRDLRVLTLNVQLGRGDPDEVADLLLGERPDVAVLTELTPPLLDALRERGVAGEGTPWPHLGGEALPAASGTVVLSAWPLADEQPIDLGNEGYRMRVLAPESAGGAFTLSAVHPAYPLLGVGRWRDDLRRVAEDARGVDGPHLVVGDFNATRDHAAFREILGTGLRDAAEQVGAGWQPTWPTPGSRPLPWVRLPTSLLRLDHVLVSPGVGVLETRTHEVAGADHLALVADLTREGDRG